MNRDHLIRAVNAWWRTLPAVMLCALVARPASADRMVWAHYVPWYPIHTLEHTQRRDFPLGMGFVSKERGFEWQIAQAKKAGIDGFLVDCINAPPNERWTLNALQQMQEAAVKQGGFYVIPCLDRCGAYGVDGLVDFMVDALKRANTPAWYRWNGQPLFFTYGAYQLSPRQWKAVLDQLSSRGHEVVVVFEIDGWLRQSGAAKNASGADNSWKNMVREWGRLGPVYPFTGDLENLMRTVRSLTTEVAPTRFPTIGTLRPGYFSVKNGHWVPDRLTAHLRAQVPQVLDLDWWNLTTWNDYAEDTHLEPSRDRLRLRLDLIQAFSFRFKGKAGPDRPVQWYLSSPWEVYWGEPITVELLRIGSPELPPVRVRMVARDGETELAALNEELPSGSVEALQFTFRLSRLPTRRWVTVEATVETGPRIVSAPILLWPIRYHPSPTRCSLAVTPETAHMARPVVSLDIADDTVKKVTATWPDAPPKAQVHFVQNGRLRWMTSREEQGWRYDPSQIYNRRGPAWEVFSSVAPPQRWGFFQCVGVDGNGRVAWGTPVWREPTGDPLICGLWSFDEPTGRQVIDRSPYGHHGVIVDYGDAVREKNGRRGGCLHLDGRTQSIDLPGNISPPRDFTFTAWVRPEKRQAGMLYADVSAPIVFSLDADRRLQLWRVDEKEHRPMAQGRTAIPLDRWTHVAATYDGQMLRVYVNGRLDGTIPCSGDRPSQRCAIGRNPYGAGSTYFAGWIDEVRLEARCLSPEAIRKLMSGD